MSIDVDYLVIGAGAMGMAFVDVILTETDATVALVDRYDRPGGHWTLAYPFVRLHQPSAFYGINSRGLGVDRVDTAGSNAGHYELASSAEVVAYFDQVLSQQFLPTGRFHFFPKSEAADDGTVTSVLTGARHDVRGTTVVDATYSRVTVPAMRAPAFPVSPQVRWMAPNELPEITRPADGYVVVGAGKTGIDACLWLLGRGVDPDDIRWIMPRDSWLLDRMNIQPVEGFYDSTVGGYALQLEASAEAESVDDLFDRLERTGQLLRIDPDVRPTMYRCATVSRAELDTLRQITNVIRLGRVVSVEADTITLESGTIPTSPNTVHVDCTADGLQRRPAVPVFADDRITLQNIRTCQQVFSAALIAHVEATVSDEEKKNELCEVIAHPDSDIDWLRTTAANTRTMSRWGREPGLGEWLEGSRLNSMRIGDASALTPDQVAVSMRVLRNLGRAVRNLERLLGEPSTG
ncbi:NAD(P)/FAD-dependent oxidoreductase [Williamsia sp.]|uniref:NAD(P)/FAD-dependent oxidoreductase n=1 Tax=Williamsia sp. TaxID=1872085 RepID=UPI001A2ED38D|nr:NAD(P)/FAD-dependent oxidoreductase [Williamsia sp.]MBJ7291627.1 NAD(P)/FAD-dependent oxidoreductase [Williamsia sp.]